MIITKDKIVEITMNSDGFKNEIQTTMKKIQEWAQKGHSHIVLPLSHLAAKELGYCGFYVEIRDKDEYLYDIIWTR